MPRKSHRREDLERNLRWRIMWWEEDWVGSEESGLQSWHGHTWGKASCISENFSCLWVVIDKKESFTGCFYAPGPAISILCISIFIPTTIYCIARASHCISKEVVHRRALRLAQGDTVSGGQCQNLFNGMARPGVGRPFSSVVLQTRRLLMTF